MDAESNTHPPNCDSSTETDGDDGNNGIVNSPIDVVPNAAAVSGAEIGALDNKLEADIDNSIGQECNADDICRSIDGGEEILGENRPNVILKLPDIRNTIRDRTCLVCNRIYVCEETLSTHICSLHLKHRLIHPVSKGTNGLMRTEGREYGDNEDRFHVSERSSAGGIGLPCNKCSFRGKTKYALHCHQLNVHTVIDDLRCRICDQTLSSLPGLRHHIMYTHVAKRQFQCDQCNYKGKTKHAVQRHKMNRHIDRSLICRLCNYTAKTLRQFKVHKRFVHSDMYPYECGQCDYRANNKKKLQRHMFKHSAERRFACDQCHYKGKTKENFRKHMSVHSSEKRFACKQCHYKGKTKGNLLKHMSAHSVERRFRCDQCDYTAKINERNLLRHMLTHRPKPSVERRFACEQCDYIGETKGTLFRHMFTHSAERQFACKQYDYIGRPKYVLCNHLNYLHTCGILFVSGRCYYCSKSRSTGTLKRYRSSEEIRRVGINTDSGTVGISRPTRVDVNIENANSCDIKNKNIGIVYRNTKKPGKVGRVYKATNKSLLKSHTNAKHSYKKYTERPYPCDTCTYRGKTITALKWHKATHITAEEYKAFACDQCTYRGRTKCLLATHKSSHIDKYKDRPYACDKCNLRAKIQCTLKRHKITHVYKSYQDLPIGCNKCDFRTKRRDNLKAHVQACHSMYTKYKDRPFPCSKCSYRAKFKVALVEHERTVHKLNEDLRCLICDSFISTTKKGLRKHIISKHTVEKRYHCEHCDYAAKLPQALATHYRSKHLAKNFKCNQCDYKTGVRGWLTQHVKKTHSVRSYACTHCDYKAKCKAILDSHVIRRHTNEGSVLSDYKYIQCDECDYKALWSQKSTLKAHKRQRHSNERPFECEICDYKAKVLSNLKRHKLSAHSDESLVVCDQCSYKGKTIHHLRTHKIHVHVDEKSFPCDLCNYKTKIKQGVTIHKRNVHSDVRQHACGQCDYRAKTKAILARHLFTHTEERPFSCDQCDYTGKTKDHVYKHMKQAHKQ